MSALMTLIFFCVSILIGHIVIEKTIALTWKMVVLLQLNAKKTSLQRHTRRTWNSKLYKILTVVRCGLKISSIESNFSAARGFPNVAEWQNFQLHLTTIM